MGIGIHSPFKEEEGYKPRFYIYGGTTFQFKALHK